MNKINLPKRQSFSLCFVLLLTACSSQQLYEAAQENRIQNCDTYPHEAARQQCREQFHTSYEDYEKARKTDIEN